jgi:hypothetical protein
LSQTLTPSAIEAAEARVASLCAQLAEAEEELRRRLEEHPAEAGTRRERYSEIMRDMLSLLLEHGPLRFRDIQAALCERGHELPDEKLGRYLAITRQRGEVVRLRGVYDVADRTKRQSPATPGGRRDGAGR